jgi:hypothetical protein
MFWTQISSLSFEEFSTDRCLNYLLVVEVYRCDMGKLLEKIYSGEAVSKKADERMLQILRGQVYS